MTNVVLVTVAEHCEAVDAIIERIFVLWATLHSYFCDSDVLRLGEEAQGFLAPKAFGADTALFMPRIAFSRPKKTI